MDKCKTAPSSIQSPDSVYRDPSEILKDPCLSGEQKKKALENWEAGEKALLRADDENMPIHDDAGGGAAENKMLERVQRAGRRLENSEKSAR